MASEGDLISPNVRLSSIVADLRTRGYSLFELSEAASAGLCLDWEAYGACEDGHKPLKQHTREGNTIVRLKGGSFGICAAIADAVLRAVDEETEPGVLLDAAERPPFTSLSASELVVTKTPGGEGGGELPPSLCTSAFDLGPAPPLYVQ